MDRATKIIVVCWACAALLAELLLLTRDWPGILSIAGVLFAVLGLILVVYGRRRAREVDEAVSAGRYRGADARVLTVTAGLASVGGMLLIALILIGR